VRGVAEREEPNSGTLVIVVEDELVGVLIAFSSVA
jgi:hypothetical protein